MLLLYNTFHFPQLIIHSLAHFVYYLYNLSAFSRAAECSACFVSILNFIHTFHLALGVCATKGFDGVHLVMLRCSETEMLSSDRMAHWNVANF